MLDLDQDTKKKLLSLLSNKQYSLLEFEINLMGNIDEQHPTVIMFFASSKALNPTSKIGDLIEASRLFERVYLMNKKNNNSAVPKNLDPLINMIFLSFKTKIFQNILPLAIEAFESNRQNEKLIEGLAIINLHLANNNEAIKYYKLLFQINDKRILGRAPLLCCINYASNTSQEYYFSECRKYSKILEKDLTPNKKKIILDKDKKIKIAFLSSDFRKHSVSFFLKDLFF